MPQMRGYRTWSSFLLGCGALGFCGHAFGQADIVTVKEAVGWYDLEDRLGAGNVPTGAGIGVLQCEAPESTNNWIPNLADEVRYGGKTFTIPNGSPGTSNHANTVALEFYSNNGSIAPSISNIWLYEAINYVTNGYLNVGQSSSIPPIDSPDDSIRVHNHSWIGQFNNANDNLALRRMDLLSVRDNILLVNGTNNGGAAAHMFAHAFNTLTVGGDAGAHTTTDVPVTIDGPGRMKPWIVAPGDLTSWTTPIVSAVAAMLYETIDTDSVLVDDFAAGRVQMMRAILLAGATHLEDWTNNPVESGDLRGSTDRPIDDVFGAGMVNVDRSHRILTGYRQTGSTSLESAPEIAMTGWDWPRVLWNSQKHWRLSIDTPVEEMTVAITWQRVPGSTFSNYTLMDIDLELLQLVDGELVSLVGDGGVGVFESGNVLSNSRVDNVELLSITGLQPGEYVLRAQRQSTGDIPNTYAGIAWHITTGDPEPIPGDINEDGAVDGLDLSILLGAWGTDDPAADIVVDGLVDGGDLAALLGNWG